MKDYGHAGANNNSGLAMMKGEEIMTKIKIPMIAVE